MENKWEETTLGEVLNFRRGHDLPRTKMIAGEYPVVGSNGIIGSHNEYTTDSPCVTIGRSGNVGNPHIVYQKCWAHNTSLYIDDFKGNDPRFIYYFLKSLDLKQFRGGSAVPTLNRNHIHPITVRYPEKLYEQKAIAHILGSLDDKIELNRRMNETLEAMAQALFTSWFVDFDPVIDNALAAGNEIPEELKERANIRETLGNARKPLPEEIRNLFPSEFEYTEEIGWIPKGWNTRPLYEIANFINGAAYKNFHFTQKPGALPVVKIAEIKNGVSAQTKFTKTELADKYRIDDGDILFSWSGNPDTSIDTFVWTGGSGWLNQHIFRVALKDESDRSFVYYQLKFLRPDFAEIARNKQTTGLGHVTAQDMKRMYIVECPSSILQSFNTYANSFFDRWYENLLVIKNLSKIRDTLIPKLLSGEMRIFEAEKLVEDLE